MAYGSLLYKEGEGQTEHFWPRQQATDGILSLYRLFIMHGAAKAVFVIPDALFGCNGPPMSGVLICLFLRDRVLFDMSDSFLCFFFTLSPFIFFPFLYIYTLSALRFVARRFSILVWILQPYASSFGHE